VSIFDLLVVQPIFNLLITLYSIIPGADFGIAVILFTIIIRFALYPLTRSMLHQSKAMRKLQPQLKRIKKEAKGNKQLESMKMLELYKENGIKPFRSILILLIQLPIFISLYHVIQMFTLHRDQVAKYTYDFLEQIPAIKQLIANPDHFNEKLLGFVDLSKPAITNSGVDIVLILLAIAAAYTQYVMSKQTSPQQESKKRLRDIMAEAADGKQADQAEMNAIVMTKMMKFLPIFMFFIMVTVPGAIALYYGVSNIVAVLQQTYLLRKDVDEMEEIADLPDKKPAKKATAKAREKVAQEGNITRITAKNTRRKS
jgi:YidC/Oxa1 family membrane protein insertase